MPFRVRVYLDNGFQSRIVDTADGNRDEVVKRANTIRSEGFAFENAEFRRTEFYPPGRINRVDIEEFDALAQQPAQAAAAE